MKTDFIFDMETSDPDDVITLCLMVNHSKANLRAVTVTPGTDEQIGLVKHILKQSGLDIPVGSEKPGYDLKCVSWFYRKWLGKFKKAKPDGEGFKVINETISKYSDLALLTGAPLKNFSRISDKIKLNRWVAQGGFAGDNVVPERFRLSKFKGLISSPTFNFDGDPQTALKLLANQNIIKRDLVSKNVCHGVLYDSVMHQKFSRFKNQSPGLNMVYKGMDIYLDKRTTGKKFHDPLALAVALDRDVCEFEEVQIYRKGREWGAYQMMDTNTFISIRADTDRMVQVLTDQN